MLRAFASRLVKQQTTFFIFSVFQHVADPVIAAARWSSITMFLCAFGLAYLWYGHGTLGDHALTGGVAITVICFILGEKPYKWQENNSKFSICFPYELKSTKTSRRTFCWNLEYRASSFHVWRSFPSKDIKVVTDFHESVSQIHCIRYLTFTGNFERNSVE